MRLLFSRNTLLFNYRAFFTHRIVKHIDPLIYVHFQFASINRLRNHLVSSFFPMPFHGFLAFGALILLEKWVLYAQVLLAIVGENHVGFLEHPVPPQRTRHEMARLQLQKRKTLDSRLEKSRMTEGERAVFFDPLLDTLQFSRHEFVECA